MIPDNVITVIFLFSFDFLARQMLIRAIERTVEGKKVCKFLGSPLRTDNPN